MVEKGMIVFSLWHPEHPLEVDLFVHDPFDFESAHARGVAVALESTSVRVIGLEDLLTLKRGTGRPQDLQDVLDLEAIRDEGHHG